MSSKRTKRTKDEMEKLYKRYCYIRKHFNWKQKDIQRELDVAKNTVLKFKRRYEDIEPDIEPRYELSLKETADRMDLTVDEVRVIEKRAIKKIEWLLNHNGLLTKTLREYLTLDERTVYETTY